MKNHDSTARTEVTPSDIENALFRAKGLSKALECLGVFWQEGTCTLHGQEEATYALASEVHDAIEKVSDLFETAIGQGMFSRKANGAAKEAQA